MTHDEYKTLIREMVETHHAGTEAFVRRDIETARLFFDRARMIARRLAEFQRKQRIA